MGEDDLTAEAGFTLVEVLVALALLSFMMVTLYAVIASTQLWLGVSGTKLQAADHAVAIIEYLRADANRLNALSDNEVSFVDLDTRNRTLELAELNILVPDPLGMEEEVTIWRVNIDEQLFRVEVNVFWQEGGKRRSTTVATMLSAR